MVENNFSSLDPNLAQLTMLWRYLEYPTKRRRLGLMISVTGVKLEVREVEDGIELMVLVKRLAKLANLSILLITDKPTPVSYTHLTLPTTPYV